jgi:hypothetical protein
VMEHTTRIRAKALVKLRGILHSRLQVWARRLPLKKVRGLMANPPSSQSASQVTVVRAHSLYRTVVVHAVAATLVKATLDSSAVIQCGESPVAEQDENDDSAKRDEVRIAAPAIILLLILGRARIHAITLKWGAAISLRAMARHQLADRSKLPSSVTLHETASPPGSFASSMPSSAPCRPEKSSTPSSTTMPPTNSPMSSNGSPIIRAGRSISPRPWPRGSTPTTTIVGPSLGPLPPKRSSKNSFRSLYLLPESVH